MDKLSSLFKREVSCIAWEKILLSNEIDLQLFICIGRLHIVSPVLFQIYFKCRFFLGSRNVVDLVIQHASRSRAHQEAITSYNTVLCDLPMTL